MAHLVTNCEVFPVVDSDFSAVEQTCCYCSEESAAQIRGAIAGLPLCAVHIIGTGDYHYITLFWIERIGEPFVLILFDNHPDDQPPAFGGDVLSCGSWVADARALPFCHSVHWIHTSQDLNALSMDTCDGLPVYLSIDLDVLSPAFAHTDWDQGAMTLDELCAALSELRSSRRIIGIDICGGITPAQGGTDADLAINEQTINKITKAIQ